LSWKALRLRTSIKSDKEWARGADLIDRKFDVIRKEWDFVENYINRLTNNKLTIRLGPLRPFSRRLRISIIRTPTA
jgi:hypothetical protein